MEHFLESMKMCILLNYLCNCAAIELSLCPASRFGTVDRAVQAGRTMFDDGAWAVDVGGESTRPGAEPVSADEELGRVVPIITELARCGVVSVDTRNREVAEQAVTPMSELDRDALIE